VIREAEER